MPSSAEVDFAGDVFSFPSFSNVDDIVGFVEAKACGGIGVVTRTGGKIAALKMHWIMQ